MNLRHRAFPTGPYNLPDWEETRAGFRRLLDSLFRHSPPTALLTDGAPMTVATLQYFAKRGILLHIAISLGCPCR